MNFGASRSNAPAILWGPARATVLRFGFPALGANTYPLPGEASQRRTAKSGAEDGWSIGRDMRLEVTHTAIPGTTESDPYGYGEATGWDSADGWQDFLAWCWAGNGLRWRPNVLVTGVDVDCRLVEPVKGWNPEIGFAGRRTVRLVLRRTDHQPFEGY